MFGKPAAAGLGTAVGIAAAAGIRALLVGAAAAGLVCPRGKNMVDGVGMQATTGALIVLLAAARAEAVVLAIVGA